MPFWASPNDHSYPPHVQLAVIKPKLFQLLTPFSYEPLDGTDRVDVLAFDPVAGGSVGITDLPQYRRCCGVCCPATAGNSGRR